MQTVNFDYFYGDESEQFSYYRIPRLLVTGVQFKNLSTDSKLLYGLMLDRMGLSIKHHWYDHRGRVYIHYTLDEIQDALNCGHNKGVRLLAELDTVTGIGLIERVKQGQGHPTRIYVKRFTTKAIPQQPILPPDDDFRLPETGSPDFPKAEVKSSPNGKSRLPQIGSAEFPFSEVPYNKKNYLDNSYLNPSINQSVTKPIDSMDRNRCREFVKEKIGYIAFQEQQRLVVDELVELITDVLCSTQASFRIGGVQFKSRIVRERLSSLEQQHIQYVLDCMKKNTTKVRNIRGYLLTALYNAPTTIEHYYQSAVQHDLYGQQSEQKGGSF